MELADEKDAKIRIKVEDGVIVFPEEFRREDGHRGRQVLQTGLGLSDLWTRRPVIQGD